MPNLIAVVLRALISVFHSQRSFLSPPAQWLLWCSRCSFADRLVCMTLIGFVARSLPATLKMADSATDHVWWMCFTRRGPGAPCARTKRAQEPLALTADPTSQVRGRVVLDLWTL
jgi:hypothetical protein